MRRKKPRGLPGSKTPPAEAAQLKYRLNAHHISIKAVKVNAQEITPHKWVHPDEER
jgi:hypothetical protein